MNDACPLTATGPKISPIEQLVRETVLACTFTAVGPDIVQ